MLLFFDTETASTVSDWRSFNNDIESRPRLLQLAYILYSYNGEKVAQGDCLIQPNNFSVTPDVVKIHGITHEKAISEGRSLNSSLEDFQNLIDQADCLVGHNIEFDGKIIEAEFQRIGMRNAIAGKRQVCTMKSGTNYCAIPGPRGHKWPTLTELHQKLFGIGFDSAHNAVADIEATAKCFWELERNGSIRLEESGNPAVASSPTPAQSTQRTEAQSRESRTAKDLWQKALDYCNVNGFETVPLAAKATAVVLLTSNFRCVSQGASIDNEFGLLWKMYPDQSDKMLADYQLSSFQTVFVTLIQTEIIGEHANDNRFINKSEAIVDKILSLQLLGSTTINNNNRFQTLVIHLYFYYVTRYQDFLPNSRKYYGGRSIEDFDFSAVSVTVKDSYQHIEHLVKCFRDEMDTVRNGNIPIHTLKLVTAGKIDLEVIKNEVGSNHPIYNSVSTTLVENTAGVITEWLKETSSTILNMQIKGLEHGRSLSELSKVVMTRIAGIEMQPEARVWFNQVSHSVGFTPPATGTVNQSADSSKKSVWKRMFG